MRSIFTTIILVLVLFIAATLWRRVNEYHYEAAAIETFLRKYPALLPSRKNLQLSTLNFLRGDIRVHFDSGECKNLNWTVNILMNDIIPWHSDAKERACFK